ncbi:hypothetical protein KVF89_23510 [Nocardioides carbamazepini]|uniref:hypothetical protein n=1 Tax=Nocardioides carbamazepini TaxID=2854259 RepID=UPI00214A2F0C|nr:hypothetical protein [Nocardioides carbamazepini]MCR1785526.1 hypothetical protein [Nocardioides carbamazepini]
MDGEQLAGWLEGLGLADQLGAAGLPSFERDLGGVARWRDPGTGAPLTDDQLADLDRVLHQDGDDPAHAVPLALVQLRRRAEVRAGLLASPTHTYASLAEVRGVSENAARFAVHKAAERGALLVVPHDGGVLVPAFQLDEDGELRPELAAVLEPLLASTMDPWQVWTWLTQPAGLLGGLVPHEAVRDADEAPIVRHAAVRLAERATR